MTEFQYLDEGNSEAQLRLATSFLLAQSSLGKAATGVLAGLDVTQTSTASASVLVAAGACVTQDTVAAGVALLVNDTSKTLDVLTANPMGATPRNDLVCFDPATKSIRLIVGTPNASPTDPTMPTAAVPLARIRNAASATSVPTSAIDNLRVFTSLLPDSGKLSVTSSLAGLRVHRQVYPGGSTDANGFITVNHAAGFTPTLVQIVPTAPGSSFANFWGTDNYTATQFRARFSDPRSTAPTTGAYVGTTGAFVALLWE